MSKIVLDAVQRRRKDEVIHLLAEYGLAQTHPALLHFTCSHGWKDVAEQLILKYGIDPDKEIQGITPLHFACTSGNLELVQYLVSLGCNVFQYTEDGLTVLHCAVMGGLDVVKYFVLSSYKLKTLNSPKTMLFAYYNWTNELIKYLLVDRSLDIVVDHHTGDTVLHYACRDGRLDRVQFLIEKCDCNPNVTNKNHDTALHTFCSSATVSGKIAKEILTYLLSNEFCDSSILNAQDHSILDCAVIAKKPEVVKHLFSSKHFSVATLRNIKTNYILLAYSNSYWDDDVIKYLIKEVGCPIVTNATTGDSVLHDVCRDMDLRKLKFLVEECECDPDVFTGQEKNSLLHAFSSSNAYPSKEVLAYLKLKCLSYKFMSKAINHLGYTPLEWAIVDSNSSSLVVPILRCLVEEYGSTNKPHSERILSLAYRNWSNALMKYLLVEIKCSPIINGEHILQALSKNLQLSRIDFLLANDEFFYSNEYALLEVTCNGFSTPLAVTHFSMEPEFHSQNPQYIYQAVKYSFIHGYKHLPLCMIKTLIKTKYIHPHYFMISELVGYYWDEAVVKYLFVEAKLDGLIESVNNQAILEAACKELSRVKFLVETCNYDPNAVNSANDETLMHIAANLGGLDVLQYLFIECKCQPNLRGHEAGTTAMKTAIAQKEKGLAIIKHLVEKCKVESDCKIMLCAYTNWCNDVMQYLVDTAGFDLTVNPTNGFTILHLACTSEEAEQFQFVANRLCCGCITLADSLPSLFQIVCHNFKNHQFRRNLNGIDDVLDYNLSIFQYSTSILHYCMSCNAYLPVDKEAILAAVDYCITHVISAGMGVAQYLIERCGSRITTADLASMLSKAYSVWHEEMILYLMLKTKCDSIINLQTGDTVLHRACSELKGQHSRDIERLKFLIEKCNNCDVTATNGYRQNILHAAVSKFHILGLSHLNIISLVMEYIPKVKRQNMICMRDTRGNSVLHLICSSVKANVDMKVCYLAYFFQLIQHDCNVKDKRGLTVLHWLCHLYRSEQINEQTNTPTILLSFIHKLIENNKCYHSVPDRKMNSILCLLVSYYPKFPNDQLLSLIKYLIHDCHMDITQKDSTKNKTVLHMMFRTIPNVYMGLIEELIATGKVDLMTLCSIKAACDYNPQFANLLIGAISNDSSVCTMKDSSSNTILHHLVFNNEVYSSEFLSLIHHLIYNCQFDIISQNRYGDTVLHLACRNFSGDVSLIERIISTGKADLLTLNESGNSPLMILDARCHQLHNYDTLKQVNQLISRFGEVQVAHPIHSYVNVILLGNPGVGKSTLAKVIEDRKKYANITAQYRKVKGVELHTAGIIPKVLNDKDIGRIILHDLAGQAEYYSSHTAVLENLLQGSAAVFVLVVSLADENLLKSLNLWLNVIKNVSHNALHQCQLIIVASHIDRSIVNDLDSSMYSIGDLCSTTAAILKYHGVFNLDCRKLGGNALGSFISTLATSCKLISDANVNKEMSLYCHMLYDFFLRDGKTVYTLEMLIYLAKEVNGLFLPEDISHVESIVSTLSSTGLIVFLRNPFVLQTSWIVADKSILLKDLDGILFAPQDFKEHVNISSNIGVVKLSDLHSLFPNYDPELLLQFLQYMELSSIISSDFIEANTSTPLTNSTCSSNQYIFVPALIKSIDKADEVSQAVFKFGWKFCCSNIDFFLSRFLHLVQLHLACKYSVHKSASSSKFERFCKIWTKGIYWKDTKGVHTLVELADSNQMLIVLTSCEEGAEADMFNLIHDVIIEILLCKQQAMPRVSTQEFIIDSSSLQCSTLLNSSSIPLYSVELLARCAINNDRFILDTSGEPLAITKLAAVSDVFEEQIFKAVFANRDPKDLANGETEITLNKMLINTPPTDCDPKDLVANGETEITLSEVLICTNAPPTDCDQNDLANGIKSEITLKNSGEFICTNTPPTSDPKDLTNGKSEITLKDSGELICTNAPIERQGTIPLITKDSMESSFESTDSSCNDELSNSLQILKSHTPNLLRLISNPHKLANDLWSVDLLSDDGKDEIETNLSLSRSRKCSYLLNELTQMLRSCNRERTREIEIITKFCNALLYQDDPPLSRISDKIRDEMFPSQ